VEAARQLDLLHLCHAAMAGAFDGELIRALLSQHARGQLVEVAGQLVQRGVGQQIDRVIIDIAHQPLLDHILQRQQPAIAVAFQQPLGVGVDRRVCLAVQQARG